METTANEALPLAFWGPLWRSVWAGAATGIGALFVVFLDKNPKGNILAFCLSLAAGVMITVSLFDMYLPLCRSDGVLYPTATFCFGYLLFKFFQKLAPEPDYMVLPKVKSDVLFANHNVDGKLDLDKQRKWRLGLIMFFSLTAHNFPEGLAVSVSSLKSESLGSLVTIAIALHNIPEGLAIATPIYAATGKKTYAILLALLSGASEPLGALVALVFLRPIFQNNIWLVSYVLCVVAGIMVAVAITELIPEALQYNHSKECIMGFVLGGVVMYSTILFV